MGLSLIRKIEPTRKVVAIIEDLDAMAEKYGEAELLALLDGELQIDNVVFLATTNYPEKLDDRIKNRPSRFDLVMEIGMPTPEARKVYLESKFPQFFNGTGEKIKQWVVETDGLSIAHLKELFLSVVVFDHSFEETITRLKGMAINNITSSKYNTLKKKNTEVLTSRSYA